MPTVIKMSMSDPWTSPHDYPPGYIQGGRKGIVFSSNGNYRTAFIEFFPAEDSMVRGEGKTIEEADDDLWEKLARQNACPEHEYEPRGYTNGAGFCKHCKKFKSKCFTAEELGQFCRECGVPTGVKDGRFFPATKDFACSEHDPLEPYYDMLMFVSHDYDGPEHDEELFRNHYESLRDMVWKDAELNPSVLEFFQKFKDSK